MTMLMRMTSDDPEYIASHLNIFFTQDGEGYVRSGGTDNQDIEMMDWIQAAAKNIGAELCSKGGEGLCDELYDNLQYGVECSEGVIAYLYLAVLQAIEMRGRLKDIEDILGDEYDLDRLRELEQADKEGRYVVLKFAPGSKAYRVWFNPRDGKFFITEHIMQSKEMCLEAELWNDAYKTREEAEKALEEMENKQ